MRLSAKLVEHDHVPSTPGRDSRRRRVCSRTYCIITSTAFAAALGAADTSILAICSTVTNLARGSGLGSRCGQSFHSPATNSLMLSAMAGALIICGDPDRKTEGLELLLRFESTQDQPESDQLN